MGSLHYSNLSDSGHTLSFYENKMKFPVFYHMGRSMAKSRIYIFLVLTNDRSSCKKAQNGMSNGLNR